MRMQYPIGTKKFHEEPNMNYTMNRIWAVNGGDADAIADAAKRIDSVEDWLREFRALANAAREEGNAIEEAAYARAVHFFLSFKHPDKMTFYDRCVCLLRGVHSDAFDGKVIEEIRVPYQGAWLPVWHVPPAKPEGKRNAVVLHLGYDSIKEELLPVVYNFRDAGLDLYLVEGPGQGEALHSAGLTMNHRWEEPVSAILDYFSLDDVTLIGLSLGGYLAPRAAAFEPRVKRVISWGVMWDFFDTVISRRGKPFELFLKAALSLRASWLINGVCGLKMKKDAYARWGIEQGMHVFGVDSPYDYFRKLSDYSTKGFSRNITQDFLLLGSAGDHFIPESHFYRQAEALTNVASFTGRRFTAAEKAENHVSFSNLPLVVECMISWIKDRAEKAGARAIPASHTTPVEGAGRA